MKEIMKARKKDTAVKPPASLEARDGDFDLPPSMYLACRVFARLKQKPSTDKFPGTLLLRRYQPGEVICRQGEPGWTAFAILSREDVSNLHLLQQAVRSGAAPTTIADRDLKAALETILKDPDRLAAVRDTVLPDPLAEGGSGPVATVYLDSSRQQTERKGWLARLLGWRGKASRSARRRYVAIDAPTTLAHGTRKATLGEGSIVGQWSCIYGTPRSATIVADRPCVVLEMLRNVLDTILKDAQFQEDMDREYVDNILQNHLAGLSFLSDLTPEQLGEVRQGVKLRRYRDGQVIFDRGDSSNSLYIVRRGVVKVLLSDWPLLTPADVLDWNALGVLANHPEHLLGKKLDPSIQALLGREDQRAGVVAGLNRLLKDRALAMVENPKTRKREPIPEVKGYLEQPTFRVALLDFPRDNQDWSDLEWRRYHRLVLEAACPGVFRLSGSQGGSENILTYLSQGDFFGEMGVLLQQPRSATCVAYVHPRPEADELDPQGDRWRREEERVELVELPAEQFRQLCARHPSIRARAEEELRVRQKRDEQRKGTAGARSAPPQQSDQFEKLGLIQGQKLMLIDLDRCTRCDECVEACVATHTDGRTRLFLDGPRFGRHLVPTTCRACRDPVCLIGCPVGSIRRGGNLQIVIEDWCIGCQLCARNCPYGSIQMHDLGLIAEEAHAWQWQTRDQVQGLGWTTPGFRASGWQTGRTPFYWDRDLEAILALELGGSLHDPPTLCFRRDFTIENVLADMEEGGYKLVIETLARQVQVEGSGKQAKITAFLPVWINGKAVPLDRWKLEREQFVFEMMGEDRKWLRSGRNTVALEVTPVAGTRGILLQLALDEIGATGSVIPLRAVVCDQCSDLPDQTAACVHACPHDAAKRVDAWTAFASK